MINLNELALKGILYDLDGVLIDSGPVWYRVVSRGLQKYRRPAITAAQFKATFGQGVEADQAQFFPDCSLTEVDAFYAQTFPEEMSAVELMDGALEVLQTLRERGYRQAVVTNTPRPLAERILNVHGIDRHLDTVAASGDAAEKPAPDLVLLALRRLGLAPNEVLYLGDSATDRAATLSAGVRMAGLGIAGDFEFESLRELLELGTAQP